MSALAKFFEDQQLTGLAEQPEVYQIVELSNCFVLIAEDHEEETWLISVYYKMTGQHSGDFEGCPRYEGTLSACLQQFPHTVMQVLNEA